LRYELRERVGDVSEEGIFGAYGSVDDAVEEAKRIAADGETIIEVFDLQTGRIVFRAHNTDWEWIKADA
jgi:hypothetical protein